MQQLIDDLKSIPGVIGAFVYHPSEGVRSNNLPPLFKNERISEMAKGLMKITAAGRHNFHDLSEIFLCYEESSILCRQLTGSNFLVVVCDPEINFNVVNMSLNLAMEEVNSRIAAQELKSTPIAKTAPAAPPVVAPAAPPQPVVAAAVPATATPSPAGNISHELEVMAQNLSKFLGPMARIIFDDTVDLWSQGRTPSKSDLPALLDSLCQEIGDPDKSKHYRELVREQLPSSGI